jgi:hypothetical protein
MFVRLKLHVSPQRPVSSSVAATTRSVSSAIASASRARGFEAWSVHAAQSVVAATWVGDGGWVERWREMIASLSDVGARGGRTARGEGDRGRTHHERLQDPARGYPRRPAKFAFGSRHPPRGARATDERAFELLARSGFFFGLTGR